MRATLLKLTQDYSEIQGKKVVLPISVAQKYHEGNKFTATLELVQKYFSECDIIVCDTLQRHNLLNEHSLEYATQLSYQRGTEWIERNIHKLDHLAIPFNIIRWNDCLANSNYHSTLESLKQECEQNPALTHALLTDINKFTERNKSLSTEEEIATHSYNYLLEETAVILSYFIEKEYHFILYPNEMPNFVQQSRELSSFAQSSGLIQHLRIRFRKTGSRESIL